MAEQKRSDSYQELRGFLATLGKNQKRFLSLRVNKDKDYGKLYDLIIKNPSLKAEDASQFMGYESSKAKLQVLSTYLFETLNDHLIYYERNKSVDMQLLNGIQSIHLHYKMGHMTHALHLTQKLEEIAKNSEKFEYLLSLLKLEWEILHFLPLAKKQINRLSENIKEQAWAMKAMEEADFYGLAHHQIRLKRRSKVVFSNEPDWEAVFSKPKQPEDFLSAHGFINYLLASIVWKDYLLDLDTCFEYCILADSFFNEEPGRKEMFQQAYCLFYQEYLASSVLCNNSTPETTLQIAERAKYLLENEDLFVNNLGLNLRLQTAVYVYITQALLFMKNFEELEQTSKEALQFINTHRPLLDSIPVTIIEFSITAYFFLTSKRKEFVKMLNFNLSKSDLRGDYNCFFLLLQILMLLENKDFQVAQKRLPIVENAIIKNGQFLAYFGLVSEVIQKIIANKSISFEEEYLEIIYANFQKLRSDKSNRTAFRYFDFYYWFSKNQQLSQVG